MAFPAPARSGPPPRTLSIGVVVGIAVLLSLMVIAFALPASRSAPHDVPLGAVGTPAQVMQLGSAAQGFDVRTYPTEDAARTAIMHREVYGAIVFDGPRADRVLVASAASPVVAGLIGTMGQHLGVHTPPVDVQGFPADDPKGAGLAAGALPLALGGWIGAMVIMLLLHGTRTRLAVALGVSIVGGLALVATLQFLIGTFDGNYWLTALAGMLGIAATCFMVLGLRELLGGPGLGIAAVLLIFLGNPLSGLASAPEMLPTPWGTIGQLLPPGATGSLLRDVVFFDGHGIARPLIVLFSWLAVGLICFALGVIRANRRGEETEESASPDPQLVATH